MESNGCAFLYNFGCVFHVNFNFLINICRLTISNNFPFPKFLLLVSLFVSPFLGFSLLSLLFSAREDLSLMFSVMSVFQEKCNISHNLE